MIFQKERVCCLYNKAAKERELGRRPFHPNLKPKTINPMQS
jgi:hypothetical protein